MNKSENDKAQGFVPSSIPTPKKQATFKTNIMVSMLR